MNLFSTKRGKIQETEKLRLEKRIDELEKRIEKL
jgi:hypothetical protein